LAGSPKRIVVFAIEDVVIYGVEGLTKGSQNKVFARFDNSGITTCEKDSVNDVEVISEIGCIPGNGDDSGASSFDKFDVGGSNVGVAFRVRVP